MIVTEAPTVAPSPTTLCSIARRGVDQRAGMNTDAGVESTRTVEHVEVGLQVEIRVAGVEPVVVGRHREQAAATH